MSAGRAAVLAAVLTLAGPAGADLAYTGHDPLFQRSAARWLPAYDWRWLRAQCYQESRFDPAAVSPAGARGLCQFMPGTWHEAQRATGVGSVWSPAANAWAAGWYMRRQLSIWSAPRTDYQRLQLAQASYNAGAGHIITAQRKCAGAATWGAILRCLPAVTGRHARETITYVQRIRRWYCWTVEHMTGGTCNAQADDRADEQGIGAVSGQGGHRRGCIAAFPCGGADHHRQAAIGCPG